MSHSPLAVIHASAHIGHETVIEPFAVIEDDVIVGDRCHIGAHANIKSGTRIGDGTKVLQGAIVGGDPQDLKYKDEKTYLNIGNHVTIREYATINRGTLATGKTVIKDHALIMAYTHVAHDCLIDEYAVLANNVNLAGHVYVGTYAIIGGMTAVQQFVRIGDHSFIGGGTLVRKDVPPYIKVAREPLSYVGVNSIGLRRRGFERSAIAHIQDIYRILFVKNHNLAKGLRQLESDIEDSVVKTEVIEFIAKSEKGVIRAFRQIRGDDY